MLPNLSDWYLRSKRLCGRAYRWIQKVLNAFLSETRWWNGAVYGLLVLTAVLLAILFYTRVLGPFTLGRFLAYCIQFGLAAVTGVAVLAGLTLIMKTPTSFKWVLAVTGPVVWQAVGRAGPGDTRLTLVALVALPVLLIGGGLWMARGDLQNASRTKIILLGGTLAVGLSVAAFNILWLADDGSAPDEYVNAASNGSPLTNIDLPDPSAPGDYPVLTMTYGSGNDLHRPEFGVAADYVTKPVDGSKLIDGWDGRGGWARTRYWGFDAEELPLQARVWYPDGDGPFPLVLIVHGNHGMEDFSDPGYGYLGELLATRGYIFASVDENFINSGASDRLGGGGLDEENDARGWLLLEHLKIWAAWNETAGHAFEGNIDMSRIGLIGHSRGGEAVAVASAFNRLPYYPDDATLRFDFDFNIRAVVAIAPVDGQYRPGNLGTPVENVNYFTLHGANDGDVTSFAGSRQFERVQFTDDQYWFKTALYILGANHGQFNTTWGATDTSAPYSWMLNLAPLMPASDQEQIAKVYISAFLDATLREKTGYIPLFSDHRSGAQWLPDTVYLSHFQDSRQQFVSTFEEDIDVLTATLPGARHSQEHLTLWREQDVGLKNRTMDTKAVYLGWNTKEEEPPASYTIELPGEGLELGGDSVLTFVLSDAAQKAPRPDSDKDENEEDEGGNESESQHDDESNDTNQDTESEDQEADEEPEPIDLTIEMTDLDGNSATLTLGHFSLLQPQIKVQTRKARFLGRSAPSEVVFQSFAYPLRDFVVVNPDFDPTRLAAVRFLFDRTPVGVVVLDDVGFR